MKPFLYKTVAIYPDLSDVAAALTRVEAAAFGQDQVSLLGRQSEHLNENMELEWETFKTVEGTLVGAVLGSIPGLVLVAGVALTGGVGLVAAGPMLPGLLATGLGAIGGAFSGALYNFNESREAHVNLDEEVEAAICRGNWVVVVHSYSEEEAKRAQDLLEHVHGVMEAHTSHETDWVLGSGKASEAPQRVAAV